MISIENISGLIRDIGEHLIDEKLYKKEHIAEVFKLQPSGSFVAFINQSINLKGKEIRKNFWEFYGGTNSNWKEHFHSYKEKKVVFLMLIPERLIGFLEQNEKGGSEVKNFFIIC